MTVQGAPPGGLRGGAARLGRWTPALAVSGLASLLAFQAWIYGWRMPLLLGPRVVLQPWLLLRGSVLYENVADQHGPLMSLILTALRSLVTDGVALARVVLVVLLSLSTVLIFVIGRKRIGWRAGLWAAAFFVAWSPMAAFIKLWYESFLTPVYLLFALAIDTEGSPRPVRSCLLWGFLGGVGILVKQHAAFVLAAFMIWDLLILRRPGRSAKAYLREIGLVGSAAAAPVGAYVIYQYLHAGTLKGFLFWTIGFNAGEYASAAAKNPSGAQLVLPVLSGLLIPAAILGLVQAKRREDPAWRRLGWWLTLLAIACFGVYPAFERFHLQPALPLLALLSAQTLAYLLGRKGILRSLGAVLALGASITACATAFYFFRPVIAAGRGREVEGYTPLLPLAAEIRARLKPGERITIYPDREPLANLYYILRLPTPKFWVFNYPWFASTRIRTRVLATLQDERSEWIVHCPGPYDIERLAPEIMEYIRRHYRSEARFRLDGWDVWLLKRLSS
jgi:hypothetical protein